MTWHVRLPRMISGGWKWDYIVLDANNIYWFSGKERRGDGYATKEEAEGAAVFMTAKFPSLLGRLSIVKGPISEETER